MGFMKWLGAIGAGVAAPFTGGASLAALPGLLAGGGQAAGAYANSEANNRGSQIAALLDADRNRLGFEQENRQVRDNALRQLQQLEYVQNFRQNYQSPAGVPSYGFGPMQRTEGMMTNARNMQAELLRRLSPEGQLTPTDISPYLKPGKGERLAGLLSLGLPIAGAVMNRGNK
jgi:hypothetical protein